MKALNNTKTERPIDVIIKTMSSGDRDTEAFEMIRRESLSPINKNTTGGKVK